MVCGGHCLCITIFTIVLIVIVGIPLLIIFGHGGNDNPIFTVESAAVKAYNLTPDNRLFCIFDFSVRAHNPNRKHSVTYAQLDLEVRKGKHHKLADDVITPFRQPKGNETVVPVEAVGLFVQLKDKIAAEMRADLAAGATTVNIFFTGSLGSDNILIKCKDVKVYFGEDGSSSTREFVKVGCNVDVYDPSGGGP